MTSFPQLSVKTYVSFAAEPIIRSLPRPPTIVWMSVRVPVADGATPNLTSSLVSMVREEMLESDARNRTSHGLAGFAVEPLPVTSVSTPMFRSAACTSAALASCVNGTVFFVPKPMINDPPSALVDNRWTPLIAVPSVIVATLAVVTAVRPVDCTVISGMLRAPCEPAKVTLHFPACGDVTVTLPFPRRALRAVAILVAVIFRSAL